MRLTGTGAIACAGILTIACAGDGRVNDEPVGTSGQAGRNEPHGATGDARHFAQTAAMAGNAEVKLGQFAMQRAQSPEVKQFAEMMVRDHTRSGNELKQAIRGHDVDTPEELDDDHQHVMERLSELSGAEFDREYMKVMVERHSMVKLMLENRTEPARPTGTSGAATTQLDSAVNQWASTALPTVGQHLQKAQQIRAKLDDGRSAVTHGEAVDRNAPAKQGSKKPNY